MERIARREQASAAPTSGEATPWKRKHAAAKRLAQRNFALQNSMKNEK
jgi:hypothetical protein